MFEFVLTAILCIVTAALIAIHLYGCRCGNPRCRRYTKPFLVPSMTALTFSLMNLKGISLPSALPFLIAMGFYTLGDILLMQDGSTPLFLSGMVAFVVGHIVIAVSFLGTGTKIGYILVSSLIWFAILLFLFFPRLDERNRMTPYLKAYGTMIALYGITVTASTFNGNIPSHVLAVGGVAMFGISDSMIALRVTDGKDRSTRVMATYILAVALLLSSAFLLAD